MITEQSIEKFSEQCKNIFTQISRDVVGQKEIIDNDYDLSINKYKKTVYEAVEYPSTAEIMTDLKKLNIKISKGLEELEEILNAKDWNN